MKVNQAVLVLACLSLNSCGCTLIGCLDSETISASLHFDVEQLELAEVTACRNGICRRGSLAGLEEGFATGTAGVFVALRADADTDSAEEPEHPIAVAWVNRESSGSLSIAVEWDVRGDEIRTGDSLSLLVSDPNTEFVSVSGRIGSVAEHYPNGERCDDEPCRNATLDLRD